jgi:steroid delta-isomerase-like uncharacterized protein
MKKFLELLIFLLSLIFILGGCQQQEQRTYTDSDAQRNHDNATQLWNGGDIAIVDSLYSAEALYHNADFINVKGTAKIKGFVKWVYTAYPDFRITLDEPQKLKDRIIYTFQAAGTNDGPLAENMPATSKKMSFNGVSISKIEDGKIIEEWVYYNQLPIYKQLGYKLVPVEEQQIKK